MGSMNRVFLMGNLTRKPELQHTPSGVAVTDLGLAVSDKYKNKAGELVEVTCFADIVVWGKQAEMCEQCLGKGAPVLVEGRLQFDQWQTETGEKKNRLKIRADRVQFLARGNGRKEKSGEGEAEPATAAAGAGRDEGDGGELPF
jgi:single-strand DNA-binding protein